MSTRIQFQHTDLLGGKLRSKPSKAEEKIQMRVSRYLQVKHPNVLFVCDIGADMNLGMKWNRLKSLMRSGKGLPDIYIFSRSNQLHCGLALELKAGSVHKKDGTLKASKKKKVNRKGLVVEEYDHLQEQQKTLQRFRDMGWKAEFAEGFDHAIKIIDEYLGTPGN